MTKIIRPCHYVELFIRHNGDVYPCCQVWNKPHLKIGNICDQDILKKIENFEATQCNCGNYILRRGRESENINCGFLNMELSLQCQGKCVMCCVGAPDYKEVYDLYENIHRFTQLFPMSKKSSVIYAQGGEILVQPKSMTLLEQLRDEFPSSQFWLCTNGNGSEKMKRMAIRLFDRFTISVYAFQQETYESISGLQLNKTIEFAEDLIRNYGKPVNLKYLVTPISIHEVTLFMKWSLALRPSNIQVIDSGIVQYIKDSGDKYWQKIMTATGNKVRDILIESDRDALKDAGTEVIIDGYFQDAFGISKEFVGENNLVGIMASPP